MYRFLKKLTMRVSKKRNHHKTDIHPVISSKDETQEEEEQRFNAEFRQTLVSLEKKLHSAEDQAAIIMEGIKTVCKFHDADWAGILILDKTSELWEPAMWYEPGIGEMGPTLFHEVEYFEHFPRWVQALKTGTPIVIPDIRAEHIPPKEAAQYERLATNSVIGAPFGDRPTGFNVNACYWMTISLHQLGGKNAAEKMISSMRPKLTEEEFEELRKRLKNKIW